MVVDDDDADGHQVTGTSATTDVPPLRRRLDREPSVEQRDSLAHADEPESRRRACRPASNPDAVVLDHGGDGISVCAVRSTLTREARECLITFVNASWTIR